VPKNIMPTSCFLAALVLAIALHFALPFGKIVHPPWNWLGLIPFLTGVALNLIADRAFQKHETTVKPFQESEALITSGVFRVTRNPMYLGFLLILLGVAMLLGSISPYFVMVALAFLLEWAYIRVEERMLAARFPEAWEEYASQVRRWI
jgi:protein-S-isoprenylcysteine O-methyltransferase Ste14